MPEHRLIRARSEIRSTIPFTTTSERAILDEWAMRGGLGARARCVASRRKAGARPFTRAGAPAG